MQGLRNNSALFWAPEKARVRQALLILSPCLGTPENAGVTQPFRPPLGPREGTAEAANSVSPYFVAFCAILHSQACASPPPCGPWEHVPPHVWTHKSNSATMQDEAEDEAEVCVLCCQKRSTIKVCGECEEHYCAKCMTPTLVGPILFVKYNTNDIWSC